MLLIMLNVQYLLCSSHIFGWVEPLGVALSGMVIYNTLAIIFQPLLRNIFLELCLDKKVAYRKATHLALMAHYRRMVTTCSSSTSSCCLSRHNYC